MSALRLLAPVSCAVACALLVCGSSACSAAGGSLAENETRPVAAALAGSARPAATPAVAVVLPAPPTSVVAPVPPLLIISELMADPLLLDDAAGEYVVVVNMSGQTVRLGELALALPSGKVVALERPAAPMLPAGGIVVLTALGQGPGEARVRGLRLPNQAGRLELRWRQQVVDVAHWHRKRPWPKARPGAAIERSAPDADGRTGAAWRHSATPLRGIERGSPGSLNWRRAPEGGTAGSRRRRCTMAPARPDAPVFAGVPVRDGLPVPKTPNRAPGRSVRADGRWGGT